MKPLANYPLTLIISAAIIVASLIPTREFPETDLELADKYAHTLMYFVLALTLWWDDISALSIVHHFVCSATSILRHTARTCSNLPNHL